VSCQANHKPSSPSRRQQADFAIIFIVREFNIASIVTRIAFPLKLRNVRHKSEFMALANRNGVQVLSARTPHPQKI
jgi:hypothetical protein